MKKIFSFPNKTLVVEPPYTHILFTDSLEHIPIDDTDLMDVFIEEYLKLHPFFYDKDFGRCVHNPSKIEFGHIRCSYSADVTVHWVKQGTTTVVKTTRGLCKLFITKHTEDDKPENAIPFRGKIHYIAVDDIVPSASRTSEDISTLTEWDIMVSGRNVDDETVFYYKYKV